MKTRHLRLNLILGFLVDLWTIHYREVRFHCYWGRDQDGGGQLG